jgi:hypothetical protein
MNGKLGNKSLATKKIQLRPLHNSFARAFRGRQKSIVYTGHHQELAKEQGMSEQDFVALNHSEWRKILPKALERFINKTVLKAIPVAPSRRPAKR